MMYQVRILDAYILFLDETSPLCIKYAYLIEEGCRITVLTQLYLIYNTAYKIQ